MKMIEKAKSLFLGKRGQSLGDSIGENSTSVVIAMFVVGVLLANLPHSLLPAAASTAINSAATTIWSAFGIAAVVILILVVNSMRRLR